MAVTCSAMGQATNPPPAAAAPAATPPVATPATPAPAASSSSGTNSFVGGLNEMFMAVATGTNWTGLAGYGRGLSGNHNVGYADVAFNFSKNVGVLVGYDALWGAGQSQFNAVKGGVSLNFTGPLPLLPLLPTAMTNIPVTVYAAQLIATPKGGNAVGALTVAGADIDILPVKNFELVAGAAYENRSGQGSWDGNYILFHVGFRRNF